MTLRIQALLVTAALIGATPLVAQEALTSDPGEDNARRGARGATFLQIGVDARSAALAGTVAADVRGVPALYWNTAGIAYTEGGRLGGSHNELYGDFDISLGHIGGILLIGEGALGLSITFLTSGDIQRTSTLFPQGGDPVAGEVFSYAGTAASLHYARLVTDRLSIGGAIRYAQEGIDGARATFVGVDFGTQFETGLIGTTIGASLTNVGTEGVFRGNALRTRTTDGFDTGRESIDVEPLANKVAMPTMFRFSVTTDLLGSATALVPAGGSHTVKFLADVADGVSTPITGAVAAEYGFRNMAFVRAGKRFHAEPEEADWDGAHGVGVGAGLHLPVGESRLMLDYAFQPWGDLDNVQVFTVEFAF